jgi:hypothetical protein
LKKEMEENEKVSHAHGIWHIILRKYTF